jgi:hypothetical protein
LSQLRSNSFTLDDDDDDDFDDFPDIQVAYRRPSLIPCDNKCHDHDEDNLSDHVKFRLWLARQLALKKFDEVHG